MMDPLETRKQCESLCESFARTSGNLVVLTGAGLSAESGIPTFRGRDGYWRLGSREYAPQQIATWSMFAERPEEVWRWYLYRIAVCRAATPNEGHRWLAKIDEQLSQQVRIVTQNVDGLQVAAGIPRSRLYEIHGNIRFVRCSQGCHSEVMPIATEFLTQARERDAPLRDDERAWLRCAQCGGWLRPHVLWFDEMYDDEYYHLSPTLAAVEQADLLWIIGTSGATTLPMAIVRRAAHLGIPMIEINLERSQFSDLVEQTGGVVIRETSTSALSWLAPQILATP